MGLLFLDRAHPPARLLRRVHRALLRKRDSFGVVETTACRLSSDLDGKPSREDVPLVLAALERTGAIRTLPVAEALRTGTERGQAVSQHVRLGVRSRADLAWANELRRSALQKLDAVERYARGRSCRGGALLGYFGEASPPQCRACDRCRPH